MHAAGSVSILKTDAHRHMQKYINLLKKKMKEFLAFTAIPGSAKITTVSHVVGVAGMENLQCIKRTYCLYEMSAAIQSNFD